MAAGTKAPKPMTAARQRFLANRGLLWSQRSRASKPTAAVALPPALTPASADRGAAGRRVQSGAPGSNPHSWLALTGDPAATLGRRIMVGILRPDHLGRQNSATEFAFAKLLRPTVAPDGRWVSSAHRVEVLLPPGADDRFSCPRTLVCEIDAHRPGWCQTLLTYITITPAVARLHEQYETVRGWAAGLVQAFRVPVLLVQHAPHANGAHDRDHVHILIFPRQMAASGPAGPLGLGSFVPALAGDEARAHVVATYDAFVAAMTD